MKRQGGEIGRVVKWQGGELAGGELAGGEIVGGQLAGGEMAGGQLGGTVLYKCPLMYYITVKCTI